MSGGVALVHADGLAGRILLLRGLRVMIDADLAELYGVTTAQLNQQVRRNQDRFPADFMFQLSSEERAEVITNCDHLRRLRFSPNLPYAFTEHGAVMLASVLNSERAVETSVQISEGTSRRGPSPTPTSSRSRGASCRAWARPTRIDRRPPFCIMRTCFPTACVTWRCSPSGPAMTASRNA
jgi:hypothetical protein